MKVNFLTQILKLKQTVFSFNELSLLNRDLDSTLLKSKLNYYIKTKNIYHIRKGFYAKDEHYSRLEFASKLYSPSYISFETVLSEAGIIFQYYKDIFVATYKSKKVEYDNQKYILRGIKPEILTNQLGIEVQDNYYIASVERAFLDLLYLNSNYYFDNLSKIDWNKVLEIVSIYKNKRLEAQINKYIKKLSYKG